MGFSSFYNQLERSRLVEISLSACAETAAIARVEDEGVFLEPAI